MEHLSSRQEEEGSPESPVHNEIHELPEGKQDGREEKGEDERSATSDVNLNSAASTTPDTDTAASTAAVTGATTSASTSANTITVSTSAPPCETPNDTEASFSAAQLEQLQQTVAPQLKQLEETLLSAVTSAIEKSAGNDVEEGVGCAAPATGTGESDDYNLDLRHLLISKLRSKGVFKVVVPDDATMHMAITSLADDIIHLFSVGPDAEATASPGGNATSNQGLSWKAVGRPRKRKRRRAATSALRSIEAISEDNDVEIADENLNENDDSESHSTLMLQPRRKRGRPRKNPPSASAKSASVVASGKPASRTETASPVESSEDDDQGDSIRGIEDKESGGDGRMLTPQKMEDQEDRERLGGGSRKKKQSKEDLWQDRYNSLVEYKRLYGDCFVPAYLTPLGSWVRKQRKAYNQFLRDGIERLSVHPDRIAALRKIGFFDPWPARGVYRTAKTWLRRVDQLREFKDFFGHCLVTRACVENQGLGSWVEKIRTEYRLYQDGKPSLLTPERVAVLNEMGFVWNVKEYIRKHGDPRKDAAKSLEDGGDLGSNNGDFDDNDDNDDDEEENDVDDDQDENFERPVTFSEV